MDDSVIRAKARLARACRIPESRIMGILLENSLSSKDRVAEIVREIYSTDYDSVYALTLGATQAVVPFVPEIGDKALEIMASALGRA